MPSRTSCSHQSLNAALTAAPNSTIPRMNVARLPPERHRDQYSARVLNVQRGSLGAGEPGRFISLGGLGPSRHSVGHNLRIWDWLRRRRLKFRNVFHIGRTDPDRLKSHRRAKWRFQVAGSTFPRLGVSTFVSYRSCADIGDVWRIGLRQLVSVTG